MSWPAPRAERDGWSRSLGSRVLGVHRLPAIVMFISLGAPLTRELMSGGMNRPMGSSTGGRQDEIGDRPSRCGVRGRSVTGEVLGDGPAAA